MAFWFDLQGITEPTGNCMNLFVSPNSNVVEHTFKVFVDWKPLFFITLENVGASNRWIQRSSHMFDDKKKINQR